MVSKRWVLILCLGLFISTVSAVQIDSSSGFKGVTIEIPDAPISTTNVSNISLDDLSDVSITGPNNGDILSFDSGSGTWINIVLDFIFSFDDFQDSFDSNLTGSGINTTGNIQNLLNDTGIYSTFNSTYDASTGNASWNQTFATDLFVNIDGDNMTGDLNMSGHEIHNVDKISIRQFIIGVFGGFLDLSGDPWFLSQTSLQLDEDLIVNGNTSMIGSLDVSENITAKGSWINGLFNWTTVTSWLSFNGADLSFNQVLLNATGDHRYWNIDGDNATGNYTVDGNFNITLNIDIGGNISQNNYTLTSLPSNSLVNGDVFAILFNSENVHVPHFVLQPGGAGQGNVMVRSVIIANDNHTILSSLNRTSCHAWVDSQGEELQIDCNTTSDDLPMGSGADLLIMGDIQVNGESWLKDTEGDWHFLTRTLQIQDEMLNNLVLVGVNGTFDLSDNVLNISTIRNETIVVNIDRKESVLDIDTDVITLTAGTNETPILNQVFYQNQDNPSLTKSSTISEDVPFVATFKLGEGFVFGSSIGGGTVNDFIRKQILRDFDQGLIYKSGFDINSSATDLNISIGIYKFIGDTISIIEDHSMTGQVVEIHSDGNFHIHINNLTGFDTYATGELIGVNKYFNLVCGIVNTHDFVGVMYCITQNMPSTEHATSISAETDNTFINFFPADEYLSKIFVPVARIVVQNTPSGNDIQQLTNGLFHLDIRGSIGGSGGSPPMPGITSHPDLENLAWDVSGHEGTSNLTNTGFDIIADKFYGLFNWTSITSFLSFDGANLDLDSVLLNSTIADYTINLTIQDGSINSSSWNQTGTNVYTRSLGYSVGIGTSNPYSGLHYQGDIFYLTPNAGAESNDNITIKNYATSNGAPNIILKTADISGAYGIGVGTLSLIGGSKTTLYGGIGGGGGKISLQGGRGRDAAHNPSSYAPVLLQSNGGNVGIGTDSPGRLFEVFGSAPVLRFRDSGATVSATTAYIEFGGTDAAAWNRTGYVGDGSSGNKAIYLRAEASDLYLGDSTSDSVLTLSEGDSTFSGNVGIGTATPASALEVIGNISLNNTLRFGDWFISSIIENGRSKLVFDNKSGGRVITLDSFGGGKVGIGDKSTAPGQQFQVDDSFRVLGENANFNVFDISSSNQLRMFVGNNDGQIGMVNDVPLRLVQNNIKYLSIISGGNVGIGTDNPTEKLYVINNQSANPSKSVMVIRGIGAGEAGENNGTNASISFEMNNRDGGNSREVIVGLGHPEWFNGDVDNFGFKDLQGAGSLFIESLTGNWNMSSTLHVADDVCLNSNVCLATIGALAEGSYTSAEFQGSFNANLSDIFVVGNFNNNLNVGLNNLTNLSGNLHANTTTAWINNRLGIGTNAPAGLLDVFGSNAGGIMNYYFRNQPGTNTAGTRTNLNFPVFNGAGGLIISQMASIGGGFNTGGYDAMIQTGQAPSSLHFAAGAGASPQVTLQNDGNLGIGTTSPTHELNVVGSLNVTQNISGAGSCFYNNGTHAIWGGGAC